jgi:hypothetical protein
MNKRNFVLGGCTTLAASLAVSAPALPLQPGAARIHRRLQRLPDLQTRAGLGEWRLYIGERFTQSTSTGTREIVLRRVDTQHADERGEQFTLVFAGAADATTAGTTRPLRHGKTGQQLPIFLQSAGRDTDGLALLRADFNNLA